ncbi:MAG: undecaprenyl/decaprenyl-phosphate alpha-N-acetylglucosaminyl 1-phosphate transferase, partial [Pirellulales bacterium]
MVWLIAGSLIPSFAVSCVAAAMVRRYAARLGLVDMPGERKVHDAPIPLGGGLAIWLGVVLPLAAGQAALAWWMMRRDGLADSSSLFASLTAFVEPHLGGLVEQSGRLWMLLGGA